MEEILKKLPKISPKLPRAYLSISLLGVITFMYYFEVPLLMLAVAVSYLSWYDMISMPVFCKKPQLPHYLFLNFYLILGSTILVTEYYRYRLDWFQQILVVATSDIFQYVVGKKWGRTPVSSISPQKTWEGYAGSILILGVFGWYLPLLRISWWLLLGILGDLLISWFKRQLDLKDTSDLLGQQGGWLDRIDSVYLTMIVTQLINF